MHREAICRKIGMSSVFSKEGQLIPVTLLEMVPTQVLSTKNQDKFGYNSLVVGVGDECPARKLSKPVQGQFKEGELPLRRKIMELKWDGAKEYQRGSFVRLEELFQLGEKIKVQGISRGMGFTGAIKRWNFATSPKTHGAGYPHRFQGSLETGRGGMSPQKVWKGKKMSGHSGNAKCTIRNLKILHIDSEQNILMVEGSVPGRKKNLVRVRSLHKAKNIVPETLVGIS
ncbi:50S ribosomal protein L3 [Candidatus Mycoplasma haematolamae str. Purdue]|uniref:Large ribosomal subunit protein uL3 n=1 Tax=Mycoplasma haematolamae (strain Purdue) TaxID=1212765 RepID=I7CJ71_MYCHA|nr:50S ribosomal protein L3 [Candidatus Mycoplasma haematolamae]AFO51914.1 50S ribosomal protein L3 [Candidatus Mycoplasma haematolamae str. Purdue]